MTETTKPPYRLYVAKIWDSSPWDGEASLHAVREPNPHVENYAYVREDLARPAPAEGAVRVKTLEWQGPFPADGFKKGHWTAGRFSVVRKGEEYYRVYRDRIDEKDAIYYTLEDALVAAQKDHDCYVRSLISSLKDATPAEGVVRVKPLEWEDFEGQGARANAFLNSSYMIMLWTGRGQFEVSVSVPGHGSAFDGERFHDTLDAAKAAAQADYERRVLSALASPEDATPAAPVSVEEAARVLLRARVFSANRSSGEMDDHDHLLLTIPDETLRALAQQEDPAHE